MKTTLPHLFCVLLLGAGSISGAMAKTATSATLTGKAAAEKLIGNTLEGHKPDTDRKRAMYFREDGALFTHDPKYPFKFPVIRWGIIGEQMCLFPEGVKPGEDDCAIIEISSGTVKFIMPDADLGTVNHILSGNHYNLK